MKVGTDGVSLGAWAGQSLLSCDGQTGRIQLRMLDIGTGSGLIALMLAQRFPEARIDAVEIDPEAAAQARENVERSPWPDRICVTEGAFPDVPRSGLYDLIVCNPPFFQHALKAPDPQRSQARHDASLSLSLLASSVKAFLAPQGVFSLILPTSEADSFAASCRSAGLHLQSYCDLITVEGKAPARVMMEWTLRPQDCRRESLAVRNAAGIYTPAYDSLVRAFYL